MPEKRLTVYPDPTAAAIIGGLNAPSINLAVEVLADLIDRTKVELSRQEWNYLADALNGTILDARWGPSFVAAEIHDADRLNGLGKKWGLNADAVAKLCEKARAWTHLEMWAVLLPIRWFWESDVEINHQADEWWTPQFRVRREAK